MNLFQQHFEATVALSLTWSKDCKGPSYHRTTIIPIFSDEISYASEASDRFLKIF